MDIYPQTHAYKMYQFTLRHERGGSNDNEEDSH